MDAFREHHVAISVRDADRTRTFYEAFGFRPVLRWRSTELTVEHLQLPGGYLLEVFAYAANAGLPIDEAPVGNDLAAVGLKHLALRVADAAAVRAALAASGLGTVSELVRGRTGIDYFFVQDPDGLWVEVVQDNRVLDPEHPADLTG